jgi:hypothetical protein
MHEATGPSAPSKPPKPAYLHRNTVDGCESAPYNRATFGNVSGKMRNFVIRHLVPVIIVPWNTARDS